MNSLIHNLPGGGSPARMSSEDMADLTGVRHDNVRRTIETLAERGVITLPQIEEKPTRGRPSLVYVLSGDQGKRDSYVIVAQLSPEFTARIVDRWQELEGNPQQALLDPSTLRSLLLQNVEKVLVLQPKADALDRIATTDGSFCITDAAKMLQMRPKDLFLWMRLNGWIYTRGGKGEYIAYGDKLASGLLEHKTSTVERTDGTEKSVTQVRVTSKGLAKLAEAQSIKKAA